jgi:hypothetical protein
VIPLSRFLAGLALAAAVSSPAFAQADFLKAPRMTCAPESVTRCSNGQCTTRAATPRDKSDVLIIDFAGKKVSMRRGGEAKPFADIADEEQAGDERRFVLTEAGKAGGERLKAALSKAGRLTLVIGTDGSKGEAVCAIAS